MAEQKEIIRKMAGPRLAPAATTLTPRDVFLILRRHILLIISLTVVGLIMGGVAWYFLLIYAPKYLSLIHI